MSSRPIPPIPASERRLREWLDREIPHVSAGKLAAMRAAFEELDRLRARTTKLEEGIVWSMNTVDLLADNCVIDDEERNEGLDELQWVRDLVGHKREPR